MWGDTEVCGPGDLTGSVELLTDVFQKILLHLSMQVCCSAILVNCGPCTEVLSCVFTDLYHLSVFFSSFFVFIYILLNFLCFLLNVIGGK